MFLRDLNQVSRQITNSINSDPEEVRKLRAARAEVAAGKTKTYRGRATKSG